MIARIFTEHPHATGETYFEHQRVASSIGVQLLGAGLAALVHGVFPFLFVTTAGRRINELHDLLQRRRTRQAQPAGAGVVP
jgi:hypothetical protein